MQKSSVAILMMTWTKFRSAKEEEISAIDGIGPVIAGSLTKYFAKSENNQKVDHLLDIFTL